MEIVQITNEGKVAVEFAGAQYLKLNAGQTKHVPWEFACAWFGDPSLTGEDRAMRYSFARLQWGYMDGADDASSWAEKCPKVSVKNSDGEDIYMVLFDPLGEQASAALTAPGDFASDEAIVLKAQLAAQAKQLDELRALIVSTQNPTPELVPADLTALATADDQGGSTQLPVATPTTTTADGPRRSGKGA